MNSRNGFGKIYAAVEKLSATEPDEVLADAIPVMEDLLDNHTISIYSVDLKKGSFARLRAASREIFSKMHGSIKLSDYPEMLNTVSNGNIWFNHDMDPELPSYIAPVMDKNDITALIVVREARFSQTSLYYQNMLFIISRLFENSIVTAMQYQEAVREKNYIPGTEIDRSEILKKRMKQMNQEEQHENSHLHHYTLNSSSGHSGLYKKRRHKGLCNGMACSYIYAGCRRGSCTDHSFTCHLYRICGNTHC
ncbi:MAG: hypothetical protein VZR23_06025 [Lachnospiraceae bacterium]|nr:hypothetical protein [Lachnospiraceae bacterium]